MGPGEFYLQVYPSAGLGVGSSGEGDHRDNGEVKCPRQGAELLLDSNGDIRKAGPGGVSAQTVDVVGNPEPHLSAATDSDPQQALRGVRSPLAVIGGPGEAVFRL